VGAVVFAATNADGFLLLTFFFGHRAAGRWRVVVGQFAGFSAIVLLSIFGRLATSFLSPARIGLLGFVPIGLGLYQLWTARAKVRRPAGATHLSILRVATIVFASGADNIAVYIPLFAANAGRQWVVTLATFAILCGLACIFAALLGGHRVLQSTLHRFGPRLSGTVLICLGLYVLWSSGTFA
jgi:cadmium resistance protein CadD (predicted permease)